MLRDGYGDLRVWVIVVGLVVGVVAFVAAISGIGVAVDRHTCDVRSVNLRLEEQWDLFAGCQVRLPDGRIVDIDSVRFTEQGKLEG